MATPDKPSQSSSNGSKNGSGDNTVAFIVIAAIVVLAVQYFLTGTNFALDIWEEFTAPELIDMNWRPPTDKNRSTKSSALLIAQTVVIAKVPKCERTSKGCGSVSLMHPMPLVPWKLSRSSSNFVRNGVFSIE